MEYLIALGANLGEREQTFAAALELISRLVGVVRKRSSWYQTKPLLHPLCTVTSQPDFLNGVVEVESELEPAAVLAQLLAIEERLGRVRNRETIPWAPRIIDLDLIAAGDLVICGPALKVPHPEMHKRLFVLEPMCEVAPQWKHPLLRRTAAELCRKLQEGEEKTDAANC
jgi:2-amino-4-hydroxy-6-hydroxymethyldihydropteridine diphosphokinase